MQEAAAPASIIAATFSTDSDPASDPLPGRRPATLADLERVAPDQSAWLPDTATRLLVIINARLRVFQPPDIINAPLAFPPVRIVTTTDRAFDASYANLWDRFTPEQYASFMGTCVDCVTSGAFTWVDRLGYELVALPGMQGPGARAPVPPGSPAPQTPHIHSAVLAPKGSGARVAIDCRPTNAITVPMDMSAMPSCDATINSTAGALLYSMFDATNFHYQIPTHTDDRHKVCFQTPLGILRLNVIPQGWINSSIVAQKVMDHVVGPLKQPTASHRNPPPTAPLTPGVPSMASSAAPYQDDSPHGTACPKHYPQYTPPPLPSWRGGPPLVKVQGSAPPLPSDVIDNHLHDLTILLDPCPTNNLSLPLGSQSPLKPPLDPGGGGSRSWRCRGVWGPAGLSGKGRRQRRGRRGPRKPRHTCGRSP